MATLRLTELETTLQNIIAKNERLEKQLNEEREKSQDLTCQLRGRDEQIRQARATRASDQTSTDREKKLREQNAKLKSDNARLHGQLQAEKSNNVGGLGWRQRNSCAEEYDRDDDEPLPDATASARATPLPGNRAVPCNQLHQTPNMPTAFQTPKSLKHLPDSDVLMSVDAGNGVSTEKRKRSKREEIDDELADLQSDGLKATSGPRKKKRSSAVMDDDDFTFSAIYDYDSERNPLFMDAEGVKQCKALQGRIEQVKEVWEHNKGAEWQFEFEKNGNTATSDPCVTSKLAGRKTKWRPDSGGRFACSDCVKNGRPCFTWVQVEKGKKAGSSRRWSWWEFRLLPLHFNDRIRSAGKGSAAIRYWVNDETKFQDKGVRVKDDGDEEYVDYARRRYDLSTVISEEERGAEMGHEAQY